MTRRDLRQLSVQVSPEAFDGWRQFAAAHRVDVAALIEALGLALAAGDDKHPPAIFRRAVHDAGVIQAERRSRRRTD